MRAFHCLLLTLLLLGRSGLLHAAEPDPAYFTSLTGQEVIERLQKPETCQLAFYELCRRAGAAKDGFALFKLSHPEPAVMLSSQGNREPPLYVVAFGPHKEHHFSVKDFQESETNPSRKSKFRSYHPGIWVFTAEGASVAAFKGDRLHGILADINADGTLELVETLLGIEITPIRLDPKPLLSLRPAGDGKWKFRLIDDNRDGIWEVEGGLLEQSVFTRKAAWNWDAASETYTGPDGGGEGFARYRERDASSPRRRRVIRAPVPQGDIPSVGQPLVYTMPEKPAQHTTDVDPAPQLARPKGNYRHKSMRGVSDEGIFRFMGYVRQPEARAQVKEKGNYLPKGFWKDEARAMALAYMEGNCSRSVRAENKITLEDSKGVAPPAFCSISFSNFSSRCYVAEDAHYFLKVDPLGSYLAFASTRSRGKELFNSVHDQPEFDLRWCLVKYEDARKVADVIWWLDRVRVRPLSGVSASRTTSSTADGNGKLVLRSPDGTLILLDATLWHDALEERWKSNFGNEVFLNFAANLLEKELPSRLREEWTAQEPKLVVDRLLGVGVEAENGRLINVASRFLKLFSFDERDISFSVISQAARYAGYVSLDSVSASLKDIVSTISPSPSRRARERLEKERDENDAADTSDSPEYLRRAADDALEQFAIGTKSDPLYDLAISEKPLAGWALRRLASVNTERYVDAMEWWALHQVDPARGAQYFQELIRANPDRAANAAKKTSKEGSGPLAIKVFALLRDQKIDVHDRIPGLLQTIENPKCEVGDRIVAIELLLSFSDPAIDETLVRIVSTSDNKDIPLIVAAANALAIRGAGEPAFQAIRQLLEKRDYRAPSARMLNSLALLAELKPELKPQLSQIIQTQLRNPTADKEELLWAVWSADLRDLDPEIQNLAVKEKAASAKRIAALWQEPDALARCRMLTTLALLNPYEFFGNDAPGKSERMKKALAESAAQLSDKRKFEEFLDRIAKRTELQALRPQVRERILGSIREITIQ